LENEREEVSRGAAMLTKQYQAAYELALEYSIAHESIDQKNKLKTLEKEEMNRPRIGAAT
jgi:hypothetical protein